MSKVYYNISSKEFKYNFPKSISLSKERNREDLIKALRWTNDELKVEYDIWFCSEDDKEDCSQCRIKIYFQPKPCNSKISGMIQPLKISWGKFRHEIVCAFDYMEIHSLISLYSLAIPIEVK